jgi:hypothetical protein
MSTTEEFFEFPEEKKRQLEELAAARIAREQATKKIVAHPVPNDSFSKQANPQPKNIPAAIANLGLNNPSIPAYERAQAAQINSNTIPVPPLHGFHTPVADEEGISVSLPSRFHFYEFKDLYIRPFKLKHIAKLEQAANEQRMLPLVEAVSTVIYTTHPNYPTVAFDLTHEDFNFVLYWLRINSFTKSNFLHDDLCENEEHLNKVERGILAPETLIIKQIVTKSELKVHELENAPDTSVYQFSEDSALKNYCFNTPKMRDFIDMTEHPILQDRTKFKDFLYMARRAIHIQSKEGYTSVEDRIRLIENESPDLFMQLIEYEKILGGYGLEDLIKITCKECGHQRTTKLVLGVHSFLQRSV